MKNKEKKKKLKLVLNAISGLLHNMFKLIIFTSAGRDNLCE